MFLQKKAKPTSGNQQQNNEWTEIDKSQRSMQRLNNGIVALHNTEKDPTDLTAVRLQVLTISSSERESVAVVRAIPGIQVSLVHNFFFFFFFTAKKT